MAKMTGAQITIESLLAEGVDTIFGYPGGAILPTYDALVQNPALRHILVRHEQGAAHMAEGYARVSGRPGVVLVTSGPGATNTVTGIADAYMDSTPLVVICGQVPTNMIGNDAFQEADVTGITRPCTKHNYLIRDVNDISRTIKEAFHIAGSGRPGPVLIFPRTYKPAKPNFSTLKRSICGAISLPSKETPDRSNGRLKSLNSPNGHSSMLAVGSSGPAHPSRSPPWSEGSRFPLRRRLWPWAFIPAPTRCALGCSACTGDIGRIWPSRTATP